MPTHRSSQGRGCLLLTLCLGVLLAQIDTSVVNLALHPIATALSLGVAPLQWIVDGYNLTYALFLLTGGLLGDLFGRRRIFTAGVAIFCAGCLTCGVANDAAVLILGRVVAGLGAAFLLPASLAILRVEWTDPAERGRALGIWAGCNGLAFAIGPTLGGMLIQGFGWRSVFLIVLPVGALACVLARLSVPESADPQGRRFDLAGQIFGAVALGGLALTAIEGRETPGLLAVTLPVTALAIALFVAVERRHGDAALVPISLFRIADFTGAIGATAAMTFGMYGLLFLLPLCWQTAGANASPLDPVQAGLGLLPMAAIFVMVSRCSGALTERFGTRATIAAGTGIIGLGLLVVALTEGGRPMGLAQAGLVLTGLGMGANTGPLMGVAVASVSAARSGTASALINVARMVGATLGVAGLGTLYALCGSGAHALSVALVTGGLVQLGGALLAWLTIGRTSHMDAGGQAPSS
ncbi:MFS transporter [Rhodanobacter sp. 7MK24]|nr:MFS transporter [Rhodanobacter sp. 7MK24]